MLDSNAINCFFLRVRPYSAFREIESSILYIRDVTNDGIDFSFTANCKPDERVYHLPEDANDNGWYDIHKAVMAANTEIPPRYSSCMFASETAKTYRDYVMDNLTPIKEADAIGKLCFLGEKNGEIVNLSKQVYYIVAADANGFMITYSGFCQPLKSWERPRIQQKVLNISRSKKQLFPAVSIVEKCNEAFEEDSKLAEKYTRNISELVAATSTDVRQKPVFHSSARLKELSFEGD